MSIIQIGKGLLPYAGSAALLLALTSCGDSAAALANTPVALQPTSTLTPEPIIPSSTPDSDLATAVASPVFCERIPQDGTAIGTAAQALVNGGVNLTVDSAAAQGWFISLETNPDIKDNDIEEVRPQHVFTDLLSNISGSIVFDYGAVTPGMEVCLSPSSLGAALHSPRP
jgi:hypothetical protein